jgi:hypothetical protein
MTVQKSIQSLCLFISTLYTNMTFLSVLYILLFMQRTITISFYASVAQTLETRFVYLPNWQEQECIPWKPSRAPSFAFTWKR